MHSYNTSERSTREVHDFLRQGCRSGNDVINTSTDASLNFVEDEFVPEAVVCDDAAADETLSSNNFTQLRTTKTNKLLFELSQLRVERLVEQERFDATVLHARLHLTHSRLVFSSLLEIITASLSVFGWIPGRRCG